MNEKLTTKQRDWILAELDKITYDPRSHKNERLFRRSDIKKILTVNTEPEDEKERSLRKIREVCGEINTTEDEVSGLKPDWITAEEWESMGLDCPTEDEVNKGVYIPPYNIAEDECNHENAAHNFQSCPDCGKSLQPHTAEDEDMCQCFTCQGSGKWASGFCPDSENPALTAEDDFQREWQIERQEMARETRPNNKEQA